MKPAVRQFDVFANPRSSRSDIPFFVVIQSSRFVASTRLAGPLLRAPSRRRDTELGPRFNIAGHELYFDPLLIQAVPLAALGNPIASLADDDSAGRIRNAIEEALTTAFG